MANDGPIIVIEDDLDDQVVVEQMLRELGIENSVRFFTEANKVLAYLMSTDERPFLIISDVRLPGKDGTELRREINENDFLRNKSIPFIFFTTTANKEAVSEAYRMMVQGYFEKPFHIDEMKKVLKTIMDYWQLSVHPNSK